MPSQSVKGQPKRLAFRLFPMDNGLTLVFDKTVKKRFIRPQDCGQRPLLLENEVNTFLTAAQAVCRETAE